ncbi:MAG: hypothetical protein M1819_001310 [Sarea resinae]|nr:MAG: hypothetical protein M1819_001310 [Sarea resinae]
MKEAIMHHTSLPRVQRDLKALQVRWKGDKTSVLPLTDLELLKLLPDREIVDYLVHLYFDTFETLYRILHRPSFWNEYQMFWEDHQAAKPAFVILMLLMMAAVSCLSTKEQPTYLGDSAIARERAVLWIEVSEWWLGRHSQKNIYLAIWQIRCLLILAKQVNIVKKKRTWTAAGTLVREAMSAGFHRDPSLLGEKVSVFNQEMRRRLWATIIELELQASVDRGMPSASAGIPSDSATVLNVDDEDLTVECARLPISKSTEYTASSYLHISRLSFSLRVSLNSRVNDLSSPMLYEEVLNYEEMITKELRRIPPRPGHGETQGIRGLPVVVRTLLDVQLQQFLILLHAPFARQADTNSRYSLSRMICVNAAASILKQHSQLTSSGNFLLLLLRHDYFRAALIICHNMYISISIQNDLFLNANSNAFIQYVEDALTMLEDRITRLGTGYPHYWYISAACALLRSAVSPEESTAQKQQAIDRIARQYYRVLASQEDFLRAKEKIIPICLNKARETITNPGKGLLIVA